MIKGVELVLCILHRLASTVAQLVEKLPASAGDTRDVAQSLIRKTPWRRQWHPTPVLLPEGSNGRRSLVGYSHGVTKSWTSLSIHAHIHILHR